MKKLLSILLLSGTLGFSGCGDSREDFVVTNNNNNPGIAAPVCAADAYTTNRNVALTVAAAQGVLVNDTPNGATLTFNSPTAQGGTVTGSQNGSFTYTPAANFQGSDTFTYTLGNSGGVVTCTVTITVNAVNGFFVDSANGNDGTGNFTGGLPFASVQAAVAAAPINTDIVVRPGNYTGAVNLKNGQRLLGNGSGLAVNPQGAVRPVFTGPIVLADGNTVDFVRVAGTNGDAIDGIGQNGGTVTNCEMANTVEGSLGRGVAATNASGTWTISNNVMSITDGAGIDVRTQGASIARATLANNNISGGDIGAVILLSDGTSNLKAFVTGNSFSGNNTVTGNAFEVECLGDSMLCLDLEDNQNDDVYVLFDGSLGTSVLRVEQFASNGLMAPKPAGAGNTGTVDDSTGIGGDLPTSVADGFCSLP